MVLPSLSSSVIPSFLTPSSLSHSPPLFPLHPFAHVPLTEPALGKVREQDSAVRLKSHPQHRPPRPSPHSGRAAERVRDPT
eukprot:1653674-Rhodomonas_salina.3